MKDKAKSSTKKQLHLLPDSMTVEELRLLLNTVRCKRVRGRPVAAVRLVVAPEDHGWVWPFKLSGLVAPSLASNGDAVEYLGRMEGIECPCPDEDELRRVLLDPSQGEWYFKDERKPVRQYEFRPNAG